VDYLEAVITLCQQFEIEFQSVPKLLTATMKDKIEVAACERKYRL
jgi:L-2-hydroxyglutarate oxidase LhgO